MNHVVEKAVRYYFHGQGTLPLIRMVKVPYRSFDNVVGILFTLYVHSSSNPYRFFESSGYLTAFSTTWLTYSSNYMYPNPNPNRMKRNQPMYGEPPFVSYTVCVNHVVENVLSSTGGL